MKNTHLKGFTLIEMAVTMFIAATFSMGLYYVFLSSTKAVTGEEVLYDVKSYANEILGIISEKIRNADEVQINTQFNSTMITIINKTYQGEESFQYTIENDIAYENGIPMKLFGHHWMENQNLYEIDLILNCESDNLSYYDTDNINLRENIYDLDIIVNIESKINENYAIQHKFSNRIFAINKFSQTNNS